MKTVYCPYPRHAAQDGSIAAAPARKLVFSAGISSTLHIYLIQTGKSQRVKTQRVKTSENFAEEKKFAEDISEDFSEDTRYHFYWIQSISGYLRNLRGRLLSSEKFSEVSTLWVFSLKPFSRQSRGDASQGQTISQSNPPPQTPKQVEKAWMNISCAHVLGCRKWGCNKWGLKGCLAALPGNRPKSAKNRPFSAFFRPFPEGDKSTWGIQKTEEKGLFPQISSDFLKTPIFLNPHLRHSKCG